MALKDLATPFTRRRIIEYGSDGKRVVHHYHSVQPIDGTLYKGENRTNQWGETVYDLYILFPGISDGLSFDKSVRDMGDALGMSSGLPQREQYLAAVERAGLDSAKHFIQKLDARVLENRFISEAEIAFVRQFSSERADAYAEHRATYLERMAAEQERRQRELEARSAEEEQRKRDADKAAREKYLGWADAMTPLRFGKADACLSKLVRMDGKVMPKRDFVIRAVQDGWLPMRQDGVTSWYGSKWGRRESKPRTEYLLQKENLCYKVSKTEYDFAQYVMGKEG